MQIGLGIGIPFTKSQVWLAVQDVFTPAKLFESGANGLWLDPSDLTTMFQDSAGTTPVTAVEQPVGLILDKSKGLVLGADAISNGNFSSSTGWVVETSWSISGGVASCTAASLPYVLYQNTGVQGKVYQVEFDIVSITSGYFMVYAGANRYGNFSTAGRHKIIVRLSGANNFLGISATALGTTTGVIDNVAFKEIQGNHAFQSTSANRPTLSARYNLLTKTEDFSDVVWTKNQTTISTNSATAPNGTVTADRLTAAGTTAYVFQTVYSLTNTPYIISASVLKGTSLTVAIDNGSTAGRGVTFDGATGAFVTFNTLGTGYAVAAYSCVSHPLDANYWLASITVTPNSGTNNVSIWINTAKSSSYAGSAMSTAGDTLTVWGASLVPANQSSLPYQRVNTATDYDSDQTKFPWYLKFNGTSSYLQTASINFTATDKMFVSAGVRKLSDATGMIAEASNNTDLNNGAFNIAVVTGGSLSGGTYISLRGTQLLSLGSNVNTAPATYVHTGRYDISAISDKLINRVNGMQTSASGSSNGGTGSYGNYPLYIGARAGAPLFFNGNLYQLVIAGKQASTEEITSTETYVNTKTKAY